MLKLTWQRLKTQMGDVIIKDKRNAVSPVYTKKTPPLFRVQPFFDDNVDQESQDSIIYF